MIKIELNNNGLFIADKKIEFPISRMDLCQLLLKNGNTESFDFILGKN